MKNNIILFISICLLLGQLQAQTQIPSYVPTTGLVGWWPFNGNANDESGNGNNGTVNGATLTTDRNGLANKSYSFSGANNYILINNGLISNVFGSFSISLWFKTNTTNVGTLLSDRGSSNWAYKYSMQINNSSNGKCNIYNHNGASLTNAVVTSQSDLNSNSWVNCVAILNASNSVLSIYVNGALSNQITNVNSSAWNTSSTATYIGKWISPFGDYHYYNGNLDDIGIWNRALTQQEVNELYTSSDPFDVSATTTTICAGQPTTLSVQSLPGTISSLTCASATSNGTLTAGVVASGVNSVVPYTGGNGGMHNGQTVSSTGVTGLTATLNVGTFSTGNGSLTYTITGTPNTSGTASFTLNIGGQTCTLSRTVAAGTITGLTCASATNNGTLTAGVLATGVNSVVPYTGGNSGMYNGQTVTSTGVTGLTATLSAGSFANGAGNLTYTITGTPSTNGTASFALNIGGQSCTLSRTVVAGTISALTCTSASNNGTLTAGVAASGVSSIIPYTGGNGGTHIGQTVTSTGITGLTATLTAGSFANGAGSLSYIITGTPSTSGTASFALNIGGQSCTLSITVYPTQPSYPAGSVFCNGITTLVIDVTNPTTGKTWMDRNLGATQKATSISDVNSYGDLYQWGRRSDGHQCRTSSTTSSLSSSDQPNHGNFILAPNSPYDWRSPQNTNLWQGVSGINNPCPSGYRIPTNTELNSERLSWSANTPVGAFASPLKLPVAGARGLSSGSPCCGGAYGYYWSSTVSGTNSRYLYFFGGNASMNDGARASGFTVRCLKD